MELLTTTVILILSRVLLSGTAEQELNLLILEPTPRPSLPPFYQPFYAEGPALFLAAELAVEMVNRNSSILEGYHLNLLQEDSGCSVPFRAVEAIAKPLAKSILENTPIVGVVGPTCSFSALHVAAVGGHSKIALINLPIARTHRLQNRTRYPYSFSILDSNNLISSALVSLAENSNWKKVTLLYDASRQYFLSLVRLIGREANITSDYLEPVGISRTELSLIHSVTNKFRIIFLLVDAETLSRIMCIAYKDNYTYPVYQYVVHRDIYEMEAFKSVEFELGSRSYQCNRDQVGEALNGSILVMHQVERPDSELEMVTASGISLQHFKKMYMNKTSNLHDGESVQPSLFGAIFYDAVWSLVMALDAAMATTDLGSYSFGQSNVTDLIAEKLVGSTFEGLSGRIQFNKMTGHVDQNAQFALMREMNMTKFSYYNKESNNITSYSTSITGNIFITDVFDEVVMTVPKPLAYFTLVLLLFGFIITLVLNITTCAYHDVDSVKASSTKLSQVAFIGCYIHALSLLFAVLIYGFTDMISPGAVCKLQHLLDFSLSIGLTVLLGTICMRIWRLHRIFNRYRNPGKLLSDQYLILNIVTLVIIDLAFTMPAFFVDPYEPTPEFEQRRNSTVIITITCERSSSTYFFLWFISSLVVSTVLLSIIFILAILTRKIPHRNFKTNSIMYLSYTLAAVVPLILGMYFIVFTQSGYVYMVLRFCIVCSLLVCLIVIPCVMLFLPPLLPVLKRQKWNHVH